MVEGYATEWATGAGAEPLEEAFALKDMAAPVYLEDLFVEVEGFLRDGAFGVYGLDDITVSDDGSVIIYFGLGESALGSGRGREYVIEGDIEGGEDGLSSAIRCK